jgi:hypothetical protein
VCRVLVLVVGLSAGWLGIDIHSFVAEMTAGRSQGTDYGEIMRLSVSHGIQAIKPPPSSPWH